MKLTEYQQKILALIIAGDSNKEIASKLSSNEPAIKYHCTIIYKALGVETRARAIVKCLGEKNGN